MSWSVYLTVEGVGRKTLISTHPTRGEAESQASRLEFISLEHNMMDQNYDVEENKLP